MGQVMGTNSALGARLRAERAMRDLTIREVAGAAGVSAGWLSEVETGKIANPDSGNVTRVEAVISSRPVVTRFARETSLPRKSLRKPRKASRPRQTAAEALRQADTETAPIPPDDELRRGDLVAEAEPPRSAPTPQDDVLLRAIRANEVLVDAVLEALKMSPGSAQARWNAVYDAARDLTQARAELDATGFGQVPPWRPALAESALAVASAAEDQDDLIGVGEASTIMGVGEPRGRQIIREDPSFPQVADPSGGRRRWRRRDVEVFAQARNTRAGRPRNEPA